MLSYTKNITRHILKITGCITMVLYSVVVQAQKVADTTRFQRDEEVLRTVLLEYFKEANPDKKSQRVITQNGEVHYFPGFGLLISAPTYTNSLGVKVINGDAYYYKFNMDEEDSDDDDTNKTPPATKVIEKEQIITLMKGFLSSYGNLFGFVKPGEKIFFYYDKRYDQERKYNSQDKTAKPERILFEFSQEDTRMAGQDLAAKTKVTVEPIDKTSKPEYEIMGKIFTNLFGNGFDKSFVTADNNFVYFNGLEKSTTKERYEFFKGLGVIYNFSVNYNRSLKIYGVATMNTSSDVSSNHKSMTITRPAIAGSGAVTIVSESEEEVTTSAKSEKGKAKNKSKKEDKSLEPVQVMGTASSSEKTGKSKDTQTSVQDYASFINEVKAYMIEYGRTLRTLAPTERLVVNISINTWNKETIPQKVELSVPKTVLDEYDKQGLTLAEAISKIRVSEQKHKASSHNIQFQWSK
ncbi:hypothetical protein QNI19_34030 [Cytophagaceae bacterium DM2B3-1]|uniref:Uncharacterized protein n=1 Tax=Xanthocytophaga flava TaxID=3048013 RepID=A0ABT7CWG1_9BACT|nr:hypothetical protein [Xanthocytophaga flavus]MDJ1467451.1 hypothetical protein [Xanthocytophaga flavus]MDJ1498011.1 hypothetical protein [Xanthocytophaga flavus]